MSIENKCPDCEKLAEMLCEEMERSNRILKHVSLLLLCLAAEGVLALFFVWLRSKGY
jgi:hypothetical protein